MTINDIFQGNRQGITIKKYLSLSGLEERELDEITAADLVRLSEVIKHNLAQSSAHTLFAVISAGLKRYNIAIDTSTIFHIRNIKSTKIFLDETEIAQLESLPTTSGAEDFTKTLFLVCAKTGARISDALRFGAINIHAGTLSYVSQKTSTQTAVPISNSTQELLMHLAQLPHHYTLAHYNNLLRSLACNAGIDSEVQIYSAGKTKTGPKWKFVTSHTARRSFATNLYLRGCDIYDISKMMGHSSTTMTNGYIVTPMRSLSPSVLGFFQD